MAKDKLSSEEEKIRKVKMTKRLTFLFVVLDFALVGVLVYEVFKILYH